MAEAILQDALKGDSGITVSSAGVGALVGYPADEHAVSLMKERGLDLSGHEARQLTPQLVSENDLILVLEAGHKRVIDANEPAARGKVYRLGEWQDQEIPDPYRSGDISTIVAGCDSADVAGLRNGARYEGTVNRKRACRTRSVHSRHAHFE
jgi:protein-tyrosine phosphatase